MNTKVNKNMAVFSIMFIAGNSIIQLKSSHNDMAGNTKKLYISYLGNS